MADVADRIRRARRMRRWSQAQLAESLGVTTGAVGHWERPDGFRPSAEHLIGIAKHLAVNLEWLAVGRGEMSSHSSEGSAPGMTSLSDEARVLVERYQDLSSSARVLLLQFLDVLVASPESLQDHEPPSDEWSAERSRVG